MNSKLLGQLQALANVIRLTNAEGVERAAALHHFNFFTNFLKVSVTPQESSNPAALLTSSLKTLSNYRELYDHCEAVFNGHLFAEVWTEIEKTLHSCGQYPALRLA